jgi:hypothetical protein
MGILEEGGEHKLSSSWWRTVNEYLQKRHLIMVLKFLILHHSLPSFFPYPSVISLIYRVTLEFMMI